MLRLGGTASVSHMEVFEGLAEILRRQGIEFDWVLYSGYDALVEAFVSGEIDLAWNGPLSYLKIKRRVSDPCRVIAMRDVDVNFTTCFITQAGSTIATVEDLKDTRFAFGGRDSVEAGVLAYHFLKQVGIDPRSDLAEFTFHDERPPGHASGEMDVMARVLDGEYDAGAVSGATLETVQRDEPSQGAKVRVLWSSPGYSHCCFTAQGEMDAELSDRLTEALLSIEYSDDLGKKVLDGEGCTSFVRGIDEGWETLEVVAEEEGLI